MKDKFVTFGIGLVVFAIFSTLLVLIISTGIGQWVLLVAACAVASYAFGFIIRDMWSMRQWEKSNETKYFS